MALVATDSQQIHSTFTDELRMPPPDEVFRTVGSVTFFNQLAVKIETDTVSIKNYYEWLDKQTNNIRERTMGVQIIEKPDARLSPPLNTAVYYDTDDYKLLPTGSLLRTSCNKVTHAFCAFKLAEAPGGVRADHRYVFSGAEKATIQADPTSVQSVSIVLGLLQRVDIEHPGTFLKKYYWVTGDQVSPAICLADYRYTFYATLEGEDILRCSYDKYTVTALRLAPADRIEKQISEVELAIYPRIKPEIAGDPRVTNLIDELATSLCDEFGVSRTKEIKYQRAAKKLGLLS